MVAQIIVNDCLVLDFLKDDEETEKLIRNYPDVWKELRVLDRVRLRKSAISEVCLYRDASQFVAFRTPIIYFVDNIRQISVNNAEVWDKLRDTKNDLVADLDGNFVPFSFLTRREKKTESEENGRFFTDPEYRLVLSALARERKVCERLAQKTEGENLLFLIGQIEKKIERLQYQPNCTG